MRILVFFDLPTQTLEDKREYLKFRKFLIKKGFIMLQESVYAKIALNQTVSNSIAELVRQNKPNNGIVQMLVVTEKQYEKMEYVVGGKHTDIIDSDEKVLFI